MKKYLYVLIAWMLPLCSIHAQAPVWNPDNGNGTFTNPIMWGDWPDPDVIRVGDDFYFVSTSMHYVPGCPIATSKDLVNWKMAGYAVDRYDEDARYDLKGAIVICVDHGLPLSVIITVNSMLAFALLLGKERAPGTFPFALLMM